MRSVWTMLVRALVRLHPPEHRRIYGGEIEAAALDRIRVGKHRADSSSGVSGSWVSVGWNDDLIGPV